jgi:hypothetical protein
LFIQANLPCLPNQESSLRALISARCKPRYLQGTAQHSTGHESQHSTSQHS